MSCTTMDVIICPLRMALVACPSSKFSISRCCIAKYSEVCSLLGGSQLFPREYEQMLIWFGFSPLS